MKAKLSKILNASSKSPAQPEAEDASIREAMHASTRRLQAVDPQTQVQWARLRDAVGSAEAVPSRPRLLPRVAFAAILLLLAAIVYFYPSSPQQAPETFATRSGEQKEIVLSDGSQITLGYASELVASAQRPNEPRRVSLTGEAYFRVQHADRPFIVSTQYADIEVVGTEFNVRGRSGGVEIGVISGAVKFRVVRGGKDSTLLLTQHQLAVCPQDGFPAQITDISPEYPGWMHSKLLLNQTTLMAACSELEMRFDVSITIQDANLRDKVINGVLDAGNAETGIAALCELTGKRYTHVGKTYVID